MTQLTQHEKKQIIFIIIRTLIIAALAFVLLGYVGRFLKSVLYYDAAAEDTIKELNSRAIAISSQLLNGQETISENGFGLKTRKGYLTKSYLIENGFFEITLIDVPQEICQRLLKKNWTTPTSIYLNDVLNPHDPDKCQDKNKISFEFSRDLNEHVANSDKPSNHHCLSNASCSGCGACQDGLCRTSCSTSETCSLTLSAQSVCCSSEKHTQGFCCSYIEDGNCCWGRGRCCPFDRPIYTTDGQCVDCYDPRPFSVGTGSDPELCTKLCPNRVAFGQDNLCMLPICSQNQFLGKDGICYACDQEGGILTSESECKKCPDRTYQNGFCQKKCPDGTLQDDQGKCIPCTEPNAITPAAPETCTTICPNRHLVRQNCTLTECPENTLVDSLGNCIPCDTPTSIRGISAKACAQCSNRIFKASRCQLPCSQNQFRSTDGSCHDCQDPTVYPIIPGSGECNRCPNRLFLNSYCFAQCAYGQFRDSLGSCHSCQDLESSQVLQSGSCSLCPNRSIILKQNGKENIRYCALQYCPTGYFQDPLGTCHDCQDTRAINNIPKSACEQCPNRMWSPVHDTCLLKPACAVGEVMDTYGTCHACSEPHPFRLDGYSENCALCPNHYLAGSWCRPCSGDNSTLKSKENCQACGGSWDNRLGSCH